MNDTGKRDDLICMRATEMEHVHPQTDFSRQCELCNERVGLFPSGQARMSAKPNTRIICNVCYEGMEHRRIPQPVFRLEDMLRESREARANKPRKQ